MIASEELRPIIDNSTDIQHIKRVSIIETVAVIDGILRHVPPFTACAAEDLKRSY